MTALATAFVEIRPDTRGFASALSRDVDRDVSVAGDRAGQSMGGKFTSALGRAAKVGGALLGGAAAYGAVSFTKGAIGLEAEFSKTMNVLAATTDAPAKQMKSLSDLAMKMGADTTFSANDASKAMLELARGGLDAAAIKAGALEGTLTLAAAGELSMSEAANTAVKAMGQFNLKGKDMDDIASALAGAANASSASVRDMSQALAAGGLAANSVGFSIQETTGILAAFSNNGLEGSDAGTSLKTTLDRLVPTTDSATSAMEELGLITEDGRNKFLKANGEYKSAAQIAQVLQNATEGLSASERKRAISTIFGSDAQRGATILAKEGAAGIREMVKATSDHDAAQRAAQANMKGTSGALEQMRGSIETAQLAWGKAIKPLTLFGAQVITQIANGAVPIIEDFGRVLRRELGNIDVSKINVTKVFDGIRDAVGGINWSDIADGFGRIGDSIRKIDWGSVGNAFGKGTSDAISVFGVVIGIAANHLDDIARVLPLVIAAFVAYKAAQAAANVVSIARIPLLAAEIASNFALAGANRALATQLAITNGYQRVSMLTKIKDAAATVAHTVATVAASAAAKAAAAGQWLLNAALAANPIGLVVAALVALGVGLVIAYKKSETFRKIVNGALSAVKDVAVAVINWFKGDFVDFFTKKIPAAFQATKDWVARKWTTIKGALTDPVQAAQKVLSELWDKIRKLFTDARDWVMTKFKSAWSEVKNVLSNAVEAGKDLVKAILGKLQDLFRAIVGWITSTFKSNWNTLKKLLSDPVDAGKQLIAGIISKVQQIFKDVANWVGSTFKSAWNKLKSIITDPVDAAKTALGNALDKIKGAFRDTVDAVTRIWNTLKEAARKPVEFVVNTVFAGLVRAVNKIPGIELGVPHFAKGGEVPMWAGERNKDSVLAMLMPGEHVWTEDEVKKVGGHRNMKRIRNAIKSGYLSIADLGGEIPAFAGGGGIPDERLRAAAQFASSQQGKPYVWGGVGPNGYDCSGFMSAITNVLRGRYAYSRVGATSTFPWAGFQSGTGQFTVGSTPNYGGSGIGHMAGTLAGMNVESRGGIGVITGSAARGWNDGGFTTHAHLGAAGDPGGPGVLDPLAPFREAISLIKDFINKVKGWFSALSDMGGWGGLIKGTAREVLNNVRGWINDKIPIVDPIPAFDQGGLARGTGSMPKATIRPERVLSPRQTEAFERLVDRLESGGGGVTVNVKEINTRDDEIAMRRLRGELHKATTLAGLA